MGKSVCICPPQAEVMVPKSFRLRRHARTLMAIYPNALQRSIRWRVKPLVQLVSYTARGTKAIALVKVTHS